MRLLQIRVFLVAAIAAFPACQNKSTQTGGIPAVTAAKSSANAQDSKAYRILAKQLSDSWATNRQKPTAAPDSAQIMALAHNAILDLDALATEDPDLRKIRDEAKGAAEEAIGAIHKLAQLPTPPSSGDLFLTGFICGLGGRFDLAAQAGNDAQRQTDAIDAQLRILNAAYVRVCSAKILLKRSAPKYAGASTFGRIGVDIDEGFILDRDDWITLTNTTGRDLHNALITVHLTGLNGDTKENTHFVPEWRAGQKLYAVYPPGLAAESVVIGRQTVFSIQFAKVQMFADEGRVAEFTYQYVGSEKNKDILAEFDVIRPKVIGGTRDGTFGGKVFFLQNHTGIHLPSVSVKTPAGTRNYGGFPPGDNFEVGWVQVSRNLRSGELIEIYVGGYKLCDFSIP